MESRTRQLRCDACKNRKKRCTGLAPRTGTWCHGCLESHARHPWTTRCTIDENPIGPEPVHSPPTSTPPTAPEPPPPLTLVLEDRACHACTQLRTPLACSWLRGTPADRACVACDRPGGLCQRRDGTVVGPPPAGTGGLLPPVGGGGRPTQVAVTCRLCRENAYMHCDAVTDGGGVGDVGCSRCASWGLVCVALGVGAEERDLWMDLELAGTGEVKDLEFEACRGCQTLEVGCDRSRPCYHCRLDVNEETCGLDTSAKNTFRHGTADYDVWLYNAALGYSLTGSTGDAREEGPEHVGPPVPLQNTHARPLRPVRYEPRRPADDASQRYTWNMGLQGRPPGSQLPETGDRAADDMQELYGNPRHTAMTEPWDAAKSAAREDHFRFS